MWGRLIAGARKPFFHRSGLLQAAVLIREPAALADAPSAVYNGGKEEHVRNGCAAGRLRSWSSLASVDYGAEEGEDGAVVKSPLDFTAADVNKYFKLR